VSGRGPVNRRDGEFGRAAGRNRPPGVLPSTFSEFTMTRRILMACVLSLTAVNLYAEEPAKAKAQPAVTDKAEAKADPASAQMAIVKKLAGTWVEADKDGKPTDKVVSVIKVTAGGSAVQETLFPGTDMEMISMYHLDKGDLVMTHYCMLGNQPKMKADPKSPKGTIKFEFAGGTNLVAKKDMHMHAATLKVVDDDHIEIAGEAWNGGKAAEEHCVTMKLVRKK
jgi:hypothetical protein